MRNEAATANGTAIAMTAINLDNRVAELEAKIAFQDDAIDKRIHDTLLECLRCAGMITTYAVYSDVFEKEEIPLDRQIRLKSAVDSLKLDVQQALHGIAYTQDDGRAMVLASKFDAEVAKLIKVVEENTKVEGND